MSYDVIIGDHTPNATFNLRKFFVTFVDNEDGIKALHGMTGRAAALKLAAAVSKFAVYRDFNDDAVLDREFSSPNGWGTWEDGFRFITNLLEACLKNPRKRVHVYS